MRLKILLFVLLWPVSARAERRLSLAEAITLARSHRSETAQAGIDAQRAELGVLRATLERIHLTIQGSAVEQVIRSRVGAGIAPQVDFNRAHVSTLRETGQLANLDGQLAEGRAQLAAVLQIEEDIVLSEDPKEHAPLVPPLELSVAAARKE